MVLGGSNTGMITSPNYPANYPNYANCSWLIEVDDGYVVQLTIIDFYIEQGYVRVHNISVLNYIYIYIHIR